MTKNFRLLSLSLMALVMTFAIFSCGNDDVVTPNTPDSGKEDPTPDTKEEEEPLPTTPETTPFTVTLTKAGKVKWTTKGSNQSSVHYSRSGINLIYSLDKGKTWTDYDGSEISLKASESVMFKAGTKANRTLKNARFYDERGNKTALVCTADFTVSGNILYLLNGKNQGRTLESNNQGGEFAELFAQRPQLTSAKDLLLPTNVNRQSFMGMFIGCTSLIDVPELPATQLAEACYKYMFSGCTSLTQAPKLPATVMAKDCYNYMFNSCAVLEQAPELPSTQLAEGCYTGMFNLCQSLNQAPKLPATKLAKGCYEEMFMSCTTLAEAPALPATQLAEDCYKYMFSWCVLLTKASALPATTLAPECYRLMYSNCKSLTTAPELPATTLTSHCYCDMFSGCEYLSTLTMKATDVSAADCLTDILSLDAGLSATNPTWYVPASMVSNATIQSNKGKFSVKAL